jgi:hypothetical protein
LEEETKKHFRMEVEGTGNRGKYCRNIDVEAIGKRINKVTIYEQGTYRTIDGTDIILLRSLMEAGLELAGSIKNHPSIHLKKRTVRKKTSEPKKPDKTSKEEEERVVHISKRQFNLIKRMVGLPYEEIKPKKRKTETIPTDYKTERENINWHSADTSTTSSAVWGEG